MDTISPFFKYKIRSTIYIIIFCVILGIIYEHFFDDGLTIMGILLGFLFGLFLSIMEIFISWKRISRLPFFAVVAIKTSIYIVLIISIISLTSLIYTYAQGDSYLTFIQEMRDKALLGIILTVILFGVIIFFRHLNRLLGPGVLIRYLAGGYYHPKRENRIFMFLDLKGSTTLAEQMSYETYYSFLNDFFHDLSVPVLESQAQIFQYVGDEVVFTWKIQSGINNANCIQIFFEIDKAIAKRAAYYQHKYGTVPEYKAGVHFGEVITAEIGDLKRDLVYNGDVLNTTSRIESLCNTYQARLLTSKSLLDQLTLPADVKTEMLGEIELRGKQEPLALCRLEKENKI